MLQNTQEWLEWRHKGLGSSDAPVVMGVSKFKTPFQLFEERMKPAVHSEPNFIQAKGHRMEAKARARFELEQNKDFQPACVQSGDQGFEFLLASLDGRSDDKTEIIEIKYVGQDDHALCKKGVVPPQYWPQVQHALMVTGALRCYYVSYCDILEDTGEKHPKTGKPIMKKTGRYDLGYIVVESDRDYQGKLLAAESKFWKMIQDKTPPDFSDKDFKTLKKKGAKGLAKKWKRKALAMVDLEQEVKELREQLILLCDHPRMLCEGVAITQAKGKIGNVNWENVVKAYEDRIAKLMAILEEKKLVPACFEMTPINPESYRGKTGAPSWRVVPVKVKAEENAVSV